MKAVRYLFRFISPSDYGIMWALSLLWQDAWFRTIYFAYDLAER